MRRPGNHTSEAIFREEPAGPSGDARVLALSPHLDDAVFSIGATLAQFVARGTSVTVCTLFSGVPDADLSPFARSLHRQCGLPPTPEAVLTRRREDVAALRVIGATAVHCDFLDAIYRKDANETWPYPNEGALFRTLTSQNEASLTNSVHQVLAAIIEGAQPGLVLTCLGIGGHVDHVLVRDLVCRLTAGAGIRTLLWEDLPYAMTRSTPPSHLTIKPSRTAWQTKLRAVGCYASQIQMFWGNTDDWSSLFVRHAKAAGRGELREPLYEPAGFYDTQSPPLLGGPARERRSDA